MTNDNIDEMLRHVRSFANQHMSREAKIKYLYTRGFRRDRGTSRWKTPSGEIVTFSTAVALARAAEEERL